MDPFSAGPPLLLLAEYAVKSTAVLALVLAAVRLARGKTASFRHFVLSLALLSLLALPLVSLVPFGWETRALPGAAADRARTTKAGDSTFPGNGTTIVSDAAPARTDRSATLPRSAAASWLSRGILPGAWAAGAMFILFRLAAGLLGARRLTREGETVTDPIWRVLIQRFLAAVGMRRTIRLKSHREIAIPLTWGLFRPVVLIPSGHAAWSDDQRSSALFHELSHVKRLDFLVMVLVRLSLAVFWFNPLSWIVFARIRKEQEKACDDLVLRAGLKPSTYAANLLLFKRGAGFRWDASAALLGLFGGSSFNERLSAILRQRLAFKEVTMKTKLMLTLAIVLAVAFIGSARPASAEAQTAAPAAVAASPSPAVPAQVVVQEKQAEKKKEEQKAAEKKAEEKKVNVVVKTGNETIPLEITIVQGDKTKTIRLSDGLTVKEGPEGKVLVLTPGGKEFRILKGEPIRIEIKGDELELGPETEGLKRKIIVSGDPEIDVIRLDEDAAKLRDEIKKKVLIEIEAQKTAAEAIRDKTEAGIDARRKMKDEIRKKIEIEIDAAKLKELTETAKLAEQKAKLAVEIDADTLKDLAEKKAAIVLESGKIREEVKKATELALAQAKEAKAQTYIIRENESAIREQAKKIREMLTEVKEKKRDFADLEKAVEKLESDLAEREKASARSLRIVRPEVRVETKGPETRTEVRTVVRPEVVTVIREKEGGSGVETFVRPIAAVETGASVITIKTLEEGGTTTVVAVSGKGKSREAYDRAVAQLKKDLPEGMTLEPEFNEGSGTITLTVKGAGKTGVSEDLVKKIAGVLKDEKME